MQKVLGTFPNSDAAEKAVSQMRQKGFDKDISIIARDKNREKNQYTTMNNDNITNGTATGGVLGALAGLAVGAGALTIPGLGPMIAAGPIAGFFSGTATGGIAGGMVDYGIPEDRSKFYEAKIKQGSILVTVQAADNQVNEAADTLRRFGAQDVETH